MYKTYPSYGLLWTVCHFGLVWNNIRPRNGERAHRPWCYLTALTSANISLYQPTTSHVASRPTDAVYSLKKGIYQLTAAGINTATLQCRICAIEKWQTSRSNVLVLYLVFSSVLFFCRDSREKNNNSQCEVAGFLFHVNFSKLNYQFVCLCAQCSVHWCALCSELNNILNWKISAKCPFPHSSCMD